MIYQANCAHCHIRWASDLHIGNSCRKCGRPLRPVTAKTISGKLPVRFTAETSDEFKTERRKALTKAKRDFTG